VAAAAAAATQVWTTTFRRAWTACASHERLRNAVCPGGTPTHASLLRCVRPRTGPQTLLPRSARSQCSVTFVMYIAACSLFCPALVAPSLL
jgi:hypothetical protein